MFLPWIAYHWAIVTYLWNLESEDCIADRAWWGHSRFGWWTTSGRSDVNPWGENYPHRTQPNRGGCLSSPITVYQSSDWTEWTYPSIRRRDGPPSGCRSTGFGSEGPRGASVLGVCGTGGTGLYARAASSCSPGFGSLTSSQFCGCSTPPGISLQSTSVSATVANSIPLS
jgi:hypothetical protein